VLSKSSHSIVAKFFEEAAAPAKAAKTDEATTASTPAPKGRFDFGAASDNFKSGGSVANLKDHFNLADLQKPPGSKEAVRTTIGAIPTGGGKSTAKTMRGSSISNQFRIQLDELIKTLKESSPRYIRCIKPNSNFSPSEFNSNDVCKQLRCAGMLEPVRIRKQGYAIRI